MTLTIEEKSELAKLAIGLLEKPNSRYLPKFGMTYFATSEADGKISIEQMLERVTGDEVDCKTTCCALGHAPLYCTLPDAAEVLKLTCWELYSDWLFPSLCTAVEPPEDTLPEGRLISALQLVSVLQAAQHLPWPGGVHTPWAFLFSAAWKTGKDQFAARARVVLMDIYEDIEGARWGWKDEYPVPTADILRKWVTEEDDE